MLFDRRRMVGQGEMEALRARVRVLPTFGGSVLVLIVVVLLASLALSRSHAGTASGAASTPAPAVAAPSLAVPSADSSVIAVAADPQLDIQMRIIRATGVTCFTFAIVDRLITPGAELDKQIALAGGDTRWLINGESWIGTDPNDAVKAFEATWASRKSRAPNEVWIQVSRPGGDIGVQLIAQSTPAGYTVWSVVNSMAPASGCD
jgi:hypothetical protein